MGTYVVLEVMCLELIDAMHYAHPAASQPLPLTVGLQNTDVRLEVWRAPLLQWSPSCHVTSRHRLANEGLLATRHEGHTIHRYLDGSCLMYVAP